MPENQTAATTLDKNDLIVIGGAVFVFEWGMLRTVYGDEEQRQKHLKKRLSDLKSKVREEVGDTIVKEAFKKLWSGLCRSAPAW